MASNIFLSYAHSDEAYKKQAIETLESLGVIQSEDDLLADKDVLVKGASWRDALKSAIDEASTVVILWSEAASRSPNVNYQAGMADALGKRIIFVLPEGEGMPIPSELENVEIVKLKDVA